MPRVSATSKMGGANVRPSDSAESILYDGALEYQSRSQAAQVELITDFEDLVAGLDTALGDIQIVGEPDGQVWLRANGRFYGRVIPEGGSTAGQWQELPDANALAEFYDATDLFGRLADAIERRSPSTARDSSGAWDAYLADEPSFTTKHRQSAMPGEDSELLAEAEGSGGHIWVWSDRLRIKPFGVRGLITKGVLKGDKDLWLDQISGLQWREPGAMWLGHIQFTLIGGSSDSKPATKDENAVMFSADRREEFAHVKMVVEQRIRELRLGGSTPAAPPPTAAAPANDRQNPMEVLRGLGELRTAGVITEAEFEQKKRDLLDRL